MKKLHLVPLIATLAVPILLAFHQPKDSLQFAPKEGTEVSMEFTNSFEFFLDDFSMEAMGQDISQMMGDVEANLDLEVSVAYSDTYVDTADGRPLNFNRTFGEASVTGEASASGQGEEDSKSFELEGALTDLEVRFAWDAEQGEYTPSFAEETTADEDLLNNLEARTDLAFLLPEGEVSVGDEWSIDPIQLSALFAPGGDLGYDTEDGGRADMDTSGQEMGDKSLEAIRSLMQGDATGTYKGLNDEGLAEILIKLEIAGDQDFSDLISEAIATATEARGEDVPEGQMPTIDPFQVDLTLDGEGTLLWDPRVGVVNSFTMSAETEVTITFGVEIAQPGMTMQSTGEIVLGGGIDIRLEASY